MFSSVVKHSSIRMPMVVNWELEQLDRKTIFLNVDLEKTIYMVQPEGFAKPGEEMKVCKLTKRIYGQWHKKFNAHMLACGFTRSNYDSCVYFKKRGGAPVL